MKLPAVWRAIFLCHAVQETGLGEEGGAYGAGGVELTVILFLILK